FRKARLVRLAFGPLHDSCARRGVSTKAHQRPYAGSWTAYDLLFNSSCFLHTFCKTQKQAEEKLQTAAKSRREISALRSRRSMTLHVRSALEPWSPPSA